MAIAACSFEEPLRALTVFLTDLIHPQNLFAVEAIPISFLEKFVTILFC
jgi:hypothetical protein